MTKNGFELYIFTTKNELCKVMEIMEKYYDGKRFIICNGWFCKISYRAI